MLARITAEAADQRQQAEQLRQTTQTVREMARAAPPSSRPAGADNASSQEHRLASFAALIGRISQHARQGSRLSVQVSGAHPPPGPADPRILSQA